MTRPNDWEARNRILEDLETNLLVEAGAGSGKTTSLVGRMVSLIRTGAATVDQIAAITFTNKAADELRERFRLALEKALGSTADQAKKQRFAIAMEQLDVNFIGTIHSFCGMLLRERPVEAGLDPTFQELDEQAEEEFHNRCWDEYLMQLEERGQGSRLEELRQYGIHVTTLKAVYDRVSMFSDVKIETIELTRPDFDLTRLSLPPLIAEASPYLPNSEPEKGWDSLQKVLRIIKQKERSWSWNNDQQVLSMAMEFDKKLDVTQNRWTDRAKAKEMRDRFHDWQITVLFPFLRSWREYLYPKLIDFVAPAVTYAEHRRAESGVVSFQDLLMKATVLLRESLPVRRYFANRYQRLLVDEFQDTDPIQAEMMFLLTGAGNHEGEKDWRKLQPRSGSLFIVGDPKQSIYRFRRADISIYNEVKRRITECGDVLQLHGNFRSVQAIGDYVNYQFESKFPKEATEQQAAFVKMETQAPNPAAKKKASHGIYTLTYPKIPGGKAAVAMEDAKRVSAYIAWACGKNGLNIQERDSNGEYVVRRAVPNDFLILLKTREFISLYAEELDRCGIPAETAGSAAIYPEMFSLAQLCASLLDPSDKVALLSVLRGELFGISDQELYEYKKAGHPFHYLALPEAETSLKEALPVYDVLSKLRTYYGWTRNLPAVAALARMMEDMGLLVHTALREAGATRAGTMLKHLQQLQDQVDSAAGWGSLTEMLLQWSSGKGVETSSLYAGRNQAVRIMNLHKAKGLEAPVVFLACPCGETDHDAEEHVDRTVDPAVGYFIISQRKYDFVNETLAQPVGWEAMSVREREFMNAEKDRLLYVAATRAKQMLVISQYPEQPAKCPWSPLMLGMDMVAELEVPTFVTEDRAEYTGQPDVEGFLKDRRMKVDRLGQPSYARISVTGLTKSSGETPEWSSEGRGMAFGSLVHMGIEAIGKGMEEEQLLAYMEMLVVQEKLSEEYLKEAFQAVTAFTESELWQRALRAKSRLHEVRLMIRKNAYDMAADGGSSIEVAAAGQEGVAAGVVGNVFIEGVIDFLFEEEDGWVIVDFKTDHFEEGKEEAFVRFYRPQVMAYASEWERTFGYKVKESGLYFVGHQMYVKL
ncbi:UvrD-helicase domain-containing protein [Paenibacillus anseongense]|uniref:UvrD-helicase domain-containing protein n=1 Tax=Paenibacillus anseongense TaxID=2682845 RepID=UPI002DBB9887|nr:UvrD-helicase domain-containing protein [Paenibacillus anseongense]MEC0269725.1 UvrD-helicase domain-containing protein [Paenibacillus anseongense]